MGGKGRYRLVIARTLPRMWRPHASAVQREFAATHRAKNADMRQIDPGMRGRTGEARRALLRAQQLAEEHGYRLDFGRPSVKSERFCDGFSNDFVVFNVAEKHQACAQVQAAMYVSRSRLSGDSLLGAAPPGVQNVSPSTSS